MRSGEAAAFSRNNPGCDHFLHIIQGSSLIGGKASSNKIAFPGKHADPGACSGILLTVSRVDLVGVSEIFLVNKELWIIYCV